MARGSRSRRRETCYMCALPATSHEHVPPKCLFPESKDLPPGVDYRKNLITVPACDKHNLRKSKDDEYIRSIITIYHGNNPLAKAHFFTKVARSLERRPSLAAFFRHAVPVLLGGRRTSAFRIDFPRFERAMDWIARGIYYHHTGHRYTGPTDVLPLSLRDLTSEDRARVNTSLERLAADLANAPADLPKHGANPEVFYYRFVTLKVPERILVHLVFYEGFTVLVVLQQTAGGHGDSVSGARQPA